jgi:hypothetical protein
MKTHFFWKTVFGLFLLSSLVLAESTWPPDTFSCYYGELTPEAIEELKDIDLLIVHPGKGLTNMDASKVEMLRQSGPGKTVVGYVTIGEDDQPPGGPPLKGADTSGPSFVDETLEVKKANNGYPHQFLDQRQLVFDEDGFLKFGRNGKPIIKKGQDGHPDENGVWGSYYVRTDVDAWKKRVFKIMDELNEMGVDGFFLDTVDTGSPWGDYGWTAGAMLDFVGEIRDRYPDKRIVSNRGLYYLGQNDRYANLIDAVLFESVLTHYNWASEIGEVSPWAKGHVDALDRDIIPAQKRTDMHLLVLDYLNPTQPDALVLVQSDRDLLKDTPHSLSFSHPNLQVTGWTPKDLLPDAQPAAWPTLQKIDFEEGEPGRFTMIAKFSGPVPEGAWPDLRITTRNDVKADRAAGLAPAQVTDWKLEGDTLRVVGTGLNKNQRYTAFLRLVSRALAPQTGFGWSSFTTANSDKPSQVVGLRGDSVPEGLELHFKADSLVAKGYHVYKVEGQERELLKATSTSPVLLEDLEIDEVYHLMVVAIGADGSEGYPSDRFTVVRSDVVPPASPGAVVVEQSGDTVRFAWEGVEDATGYRLYVVPKEQDFRLPMRVEETEVEVQNVQPGKYKIFLTSVDGAGNQSRPGPSVQVSVK